MILFVLFACYFSNTQPTAHVEIVESEIEIEWIQGE